MVPQFAGRNVRRRAFLLYFMMWRLFAKGWLSIRSVWSGLKVGPLPIHNVARGVDSAKTRSRLDDDFRRQEGP